ncbi:nucleotidyltransferase domain-containing protein [Spirosoma knui]
MRYGLSDAHLLDIVNTIASTPRIQRAVLFGSRAKGNQRPGSDIDIALKGDRLALNDLLAVSVALDELGLPFKFDLILYDRISEPALQEHIDRVGKVMVPH